MKELLTFCFASLLALNPGFGQETHKFELLGKWDDNSLPIAAPDWIQLQYSGCWGIAVNGHEYAVLGGAEHVLFFDITEPSTPKLVGKFKGTANTIWREFKSYKNRVYAVSDGTSEGLMIFDMSHAEDTIVRTYWSNEIFNAAHTITLDTTSGRIYLNGGSATMGIIVLDVKENPDKPKFLAHAVYQAGGLHDSYVRNDTIYASSGNAGYFIYDMKTPTAPVLLAQISTGGYNHNSWLNSAGTYAYYTEEVPSGLPIRIVDLQNLAMGDIEVVGSFLDKFTPEGGPNSAIPHNVYIRDNTLFDSQYEDGLVAYDISTPTAPVLLAQYDTHPQNTQYNTYYGNWGNYPWLPSGNIIAGDMQNGLFVLKLKSSSSGATNTSAELAARVSPNPANTFLNISLPDNAPAGWSWSINSTTGQTLRSGQEQNPQAQVDVAALPRGVYFLQLRDQAEGRSTIKKIVLN